MTDKLTISAPPHIRIINGTNRIMLDVIIALIPSIIAGTIFFGLRAALIVLISVLSSILFEHLLAILYKKPSTIRDLSSTVSGIILALNLPVSVPLWLPIAGSFLMIVVFKMLFGGLGRNLLNPAATARIFLLLLWTKYMTAWTAPFSSINIITAADAITTDTPLAYLSVADSLHSMPTLLDLYFGRTSGCIGETCAFAIMLGGLYLLMRKVIDWRIPVFYLGSTSILLMLFGQNVPYHLLSGGLLFGAVFMATDYTTSPISPKGHIVYGIGLAAMTVLFRLNSAAPENVVLSIVFMNVLTPLIDKYAIPRRFGWKKPVI